MRLPFISTPVPLSTFNAQLDAYRRTFAPAPVSVFGRGGRAVLGSLSPLSSAGFATVPVPVKNAIQASGFGINRTPGPTNLIKRQGT